MADIVASSKRKINLFDRVIQSVVILVNMNKMNRAIDEHLLVIHKTDGDEEKLSQENILREIVFVKYQYDIMQRDMYELKISYPTEITNNINSTDKTERFELQKTFLEMEYDRITKSKFKSREDVKYNLLSISSAIDSVKQNIKDEGKSQRYNKVIKSAEDIDTKIQTEEYSEELYNDLFEIIDEYVGYINDNYDIAKLPTDERELIEFVIETMIKGIESDIDRHMYEYNLVINICKNSYRYFKIIDKIFEKLQKIYDENLEKGIMTLKDYLKMFRDIYDLKIKTMVNDVHRTIKTEDEYLEYSRLITSTDVETVTLDEFILQRALELTKIDKVQNIIKHSINKEGINENPEIIVEDFNIDIETENADIQDKIEEVVAKKATKEKKEKVVKEKVVKKVKSIVVKVPKAAKKIKLEK